MSVSEYKELTIKFWKAWLKGEKDEYNSINDQLCLIYSKMNEAEKEQITREIDHSGIISDLKKPVLTKTNYQLN